MHSRHSPPVPRQTARLLLSSGQVYCLTTATLLILGSMVLNWHATTIGLIAAAIVFELLYVGFKLVVHVASYSVPQGTQAVACDYPDLPKYTILVPLYKEANMLPTLVQSLTNLRYPESRLQVLLLLEADDVETQAEAIAMDMPYYFDIVVVPDLLPKGKPKALNIGLQHATGAFCVIYDAEDRPEPDQLLKAVGSFRAASEDVGCIQARLQFWNVATSWITRFYTAEYDVHFWRVLPGLAKLGLVPPLGGTSNHFRTDVLRKIAFDFDQLPEGAEGIGGWDPWNVTEDAELAGALALQGYRVLMLDSSTGEEATAHLRIADKQRRRWLKGYLQTGLVFTRNPVRTARQMGFRRWFGYNLLLLGTPISLWLNPLFWGLTITYFITRSPTIEGLFPRPLFYAGLLLTLCNVVLFFQLACACMARGKYTSIKYMVLVLVWWPFTSWSAYQVLWEISRKSTRHKWNKTPHGHDLHKEEAHEEASAVGVSR